MTRRIITAIDVGTTKIATIVANAKSEDSIEILGVGLAPSHGLHKGIVVNMENAKASIAESVREAEQISGTRIDSACVGVTGRHISSVNNKGVVTIPHSDRMVRAKDLKRVLSAARSITIPDGKKILHAIPRGYTLDGLDRVNQPVGMHGARLDAETHVIVASIASVQNLAKCVRSLGIDIDDMVLEPLASGEAVLTPQERETGVIMADIGGGTTDIAVFKGGSIYHTAILPVAGYQLTSDISIGLGLPFNVAEAMKKKYGNVTPGLDFETAEVEMGIENGHSGSYRDLCTIVRSRIEELLELVLLEMPVSDYASLAPCGLVLTGGSSNMAGLDALGQSKIDIPVRIGRPLNANIYGITDILHDAAYATTVGLILWQTRNNGTSAWQEKNRAGIFSTFAGLIKRIFR